MAQLPPIPPDVVWFSPTVDVGPSSSSFAFWMLWPGLGPGDASWAQQVVDNWFINLQPYFLDCMHSESRFRTCRLMVGGSPPFRHEAVLADNEGALSPGVLPAVSAGVYLQSSGGGKGSGTRLHIPALGNEMIDDFVYLSAYGQQQLQFVAVGLAFWPTQLAGLGRGTPVLGTLQRRRAGSNLPTAQFDPMQFIRTTLRLETTSRRQHQVRGVSP